MYINEDNLEKNGVNITIFIIQLFYSLIKELKLTEWLFYSDKSNVTGRHFSLSFSLSFSLPSLSPILSFSFSHILLLLSLSLSDWDYKIIKNSSKDTNLFVCLFDINSLLIVDTYNLHVLFLCYLYSFIHIEIFHIPMVTFITSHL